MAGNLVSKFNHSSRYYLMNIRRHINNVLENPVNIPCVVNGKVYNTNISQQISSYDNICQHSTTQNLILKHITK